MLRQDSPRTSPNRNGSAPETGVNSTTTKANPASLSVDIQQELNRLEEIILDSPRVLLTRRTMVDEVQLLDQLDLVRLNLPTAFQEALELLRQREAMLTEAEQYSQQMVEAAEQRAAQILDEIGIIRQAEAEAQQIRQRVQQECDLLRQQVMLEIEEMHHQARAEMDQMRQVAIADCEEIQRGADEYADHVLEDMEHRLNEMLRVVHNGRQQLQVEDTQTTPTSSAKPGSPASRSNASAPSSSRPAPSPSRPSTAASTTNTSRRAPESQQR